MKSNILAATLGCVIGVLATIGWACWKVLKDMDSKDSDIVGRDYDAMTRQQQIEYLTRKLSIE